MKTQIAPGHAFYDDPNFAFGFEFIKEGDKVLDYGCYDCRFGKTLLRHKKVDYHGVDKDLSIVEKNRKSYQVVPADFPLPYADGYFDVVVAFEVVEHIHDQKTVLRELRRVLSDEGLLIVSVPRKHIFSALDEGNWKFVFPRLHHAFYRLRHSEEEYLDRYVRGINGLIGNVEVEKRWHQHFEDDELIELLGDCGFRVSVLDGYGYFGLLMNFLALCGLGFLFPKSLRNRDNYAFASHHLTVVARKSRPDGPAKTKTPRRRSSRAASSPQPSAA